MIVAKKSVGSLVTPEMRRAFYRAFLRAIPLVPGPELFDILEAARRSRESVDAKISEALNALKSASGLIDELEDGLKDRTEKLTRLKEEVDRYSKLAEVEEEKAKALLSQLDLTLRKGRGRERWISLAINLVVGVLIFMLGIIAAPALSQWWQSRQSFEGQTKPAANATLPPTKK